ncbi:hypothetical protein ENKNEFLB_00533 [Nocardioides aquaticus]|uniref:Secreted protein n=1 Tax=Nocardioides aquaticus TaxID=160826 RepID=A0ABX8EE62_9ACTN|nr:hypothetical protein [Nocardioides aquaticus]QVT78160.1 hypothetical protein ENKNEFLB_00533 [Nocardioides aquaticus]
MTVVLCVLAFLAAILLVDLVLDRRLAARLKRGGRGEVGSQPFNAAAEEHGIERSAQQGRDATYGSGF